MYIIGNKMLKTVFLLTIILVWTGIGQPVQTPDDEPTLQKPDKKFAFYKKLDIGATFKAIEDQVTNSEISSREITTPISTDKYLLGSFAFNLQKYFKYCDRCERLQYFAFRVGSNYLTAKSSYLQLESSSSPTNSQLFIAEQQVDGTWAFKSLTQNKWIRASNDGSTINYQTFIGAWERWYIERHGDHVHIQSAQFAYCWWIFDHGRLEQLYGGASALEVEYYPKLQWLWNW